MNTAPHLEKNYQFSLRFVRVVIIFVWIATALAYGIFIYSAHPKGLSDWLLSIAIAFPFAASAGFIHAILSAVIAVFDMANDNAEMLIEAKRQTLLLNKMKPNG